MDWWTLAWVSYGFALLVVAVLLMLMRQGKGDTRLFRVIGMVGLALPIIGSPLCIELAQR